MASPLRGPTARPGGTRAAARELRALPSPRVRLAGGVAFQPWERLASLLTLQRRCRNADLDVRGARDPDASPGPGGIGRPARDTARGGSSRTSADVHPVSSASAAQVAG